MNVTPMCDICHKEKAVIHFLDKTVSQQGDVCRGCMWIPTDHTVVLSPCKDRSKGAKKKELPSDLLMIKQYAEEVLKSIYGIQNDTGHMPGGQPMSLWHMENISTYIQLLNQRGRLGNVILRDIEFLVRHADKLVGLGHESNVPGPLRVAGLDVSAALRRLQIEMLRLELKKKGLET